jgi:hypothetical protein
VPGSLTRLLYLVAVQQLVLGTEPSEETEQRGNHERGVDQDNSSDCLPPCHGRKHRHLRHAPRSRFVSTFGILGLSLLPGGMQDPPSPAVGRVAREVADQRPANWRLPSSSPSRKRMERPLVIVTSVTSDQATVAVEKKLVVDTCVSVNLIAVC